VEVIVVVEVELEMLAYLDKYVQLMRHELNTDLRLLLLKRFKRKSIFQDCYYLHVDVCGGRGGGGIVGLGSFIVVKGGGGGGTNCESRCIFGISCIGGGGICVVSKPCVVGRGNWIGCGNVGNDVCWFPIVNFGWINDVDCWVFAGFNGVNADDGGWNALGIDGGRTEGWINGDGKCETDVGGWRSGYNVWILFGFCWNINGEPLDGNWFRLFGAGKSGLNGVLAEGINGALNKKRNFIRTKYDD
jgi:hypothetical protein